MSLQVSDEHDGTAWDNYLDRHAMVSPMNRYAWRQVLEQSYNVTCHFLSARNEDGEIQGVCPLYIVPFFDGTQRIFSLRHGLVGDDEAISHLIDAIVKLGKEASVEITSGLELKHVDFPTQTKKTFLFPLVGDPEEVWRGLRSETRNRIKKAEQSLVAEHGFQNLRSFYQAYSDSMTLKGVLINSYSFFQNIERGFSDSAELIVAKNDGRVVGGIILIFSKSMAVYPYVANFPWAQQFATAHFLVWHAIKYCLARGVSFLDMGESSLGGGVYMFKERFGGIPKDVYYYQIKAAPSGTAHYSRFMPNAVLLSALQNNTIARYVPARLRQYMSVRCKSKCRLV